MHDWAVPGKRVVYIYDIPPEIVRYMADLYPGIAGPKRGVVYVIRDVVESGCSRNGRAVLVKLVELINPELPCPCGCGVVGEAGFLVDHFRPVRDTSIECLRGLLAPTPGWTKKVLEDA